MAPEQPNLPAQSSASQPGLPPVEPPSGRFIVQLFVVPGVIVLAVVLLLMAISYMSAQNRPDYLLHRLDSDNADIRWRAASDLAQILKRPESSERWKADAHFTLELAERLRSALDELRGAERKAEEEVAKLRQEAAAREARGLTMTAAELEAPWRKLAPLRNHVSFLASALGDLHVPAGIPLLAEICLHDVSPDLKGNTLQRRKALWSLANLGANTRGFATLPSEKQAEVLQVLRAEASGSTPRAGWARTALYYLDTAATRPADVIRMDEVLAHCAEAPDRYLREQVALAFNFWDGPLAEPTLLKLANDDGHGTLVRVTETD